MSTWREIGGRPPGALRTAHLDSLAHPQELYLEQRVGSGHTMVLSGGSGRVEGYAVVSDGAVVEFHVIADSLIDDPFGSLLLASGATRTLAMSFDAVTLRAARSHSTSERSIAHLFRSFTPSDMALGDITTRYASPADRERVVEMHDGFFDDLAEMDRYIDARSLTLFERASDLVGCGITTRVVSGRDAVDVGMVVAVGERGRGLGAMIAAHLAERCVATGDRPIAGCAVGNVASRRALERAGFRSDHTLVEIDH